MSATRRALEEHAQRLADRHAQMQAQVSQNLGEDESVLADLVGRASRPTGALQAMQAMNQLLALQAKQSSNRSGSRSRKTGRPRWNWRGRRRPRSAPAVRRRFLGTGTPYTPQTVNFYGN